MKTMDRANLIVKDGPHCILCTRKKSMLNC